MCRLLFAGERAMARTSPWLGHKNGGALAMKTYGHLRNEHSQAMAQKVKF